MQFRSLSIRSQVTAITMLASATALVFACASFLGYEIISSRRDAIDGLLPIAEIIGMKGAATLIHKDAASASEVLALAAEERAFTDAGLYLTNGVRLAAYSRDADVCDPPARIRGIPQNYCPGGKVCVYKEVAVGRQALGAVYVCSDIPHIWERLRKYAGMACGILFLCLLEALALSAKFHRVILNPIVELTRLSERVSREHDYSARAPNAPARNELGILTREFNNMLQQVQEKDARLKKAYADVEQKVQERTEELSALNRRLQEDIAARKLAEEREKVLGEQLVRAERLKSLGVLAGGIAHDLNNALGPMLLLPRAISRRVEEIRERHGENMEETVKDLAALEASAKHASTMIADLMALGRPRKQLKAAIDLNEIIGEFMLSQQVERIKTTKPKITVSVDLAGGIPKIRGSRHHLIRALSNLTRNSFDAIEGNGAVTIKTSSVHIAEPVAGYEMIEPGNYVTIHVSDTGSGIEKKDIEKIFEPFFTTRPHDQYGGSGLGLSVVHAVVKDHEGFIDVKSSPGKGTTFTLFIPALLAEKQERNS